jgi:hypothetical protein
MFSSDTLQQVNDEIAHLASMVARQRNLLDQRRATGCDTAEAELALHNLTALYRKRMRAREVLQESSGGAPA